LRLLPSSFETMSELEEREGDEVYLSPGLCRRVYGIWGGQKLTLSLQNRPKRDGKLAAGGGTDPNVNEEGSSSNGSEKAKESGSGGEKVLEVRIRENSRIGMGQVWVGDKLRAELGVGERAFELLK